MFDPWDEDDPKPCLYFSDATFSATNEGPPKAASAHLNSKPFDLDVLRKVL